MSYEQPQLLTTADGRTLAWTETGAPDGKVLFAIHGSPGCRLARYRDAEQLTKAGIRQLSYDRAGYGRSDAKPGRTIADVVDDMVAVLDAAGVEKAALIGTSGGGAHVLAAATLIPDRVSLAWCNVGVAPYTELGEDSFFEGMDGENIRRFRSAMHESRQQSYDELAPDMQERLEALANGGNIYGGMNLPEADLAIIRAEQGALAENVLEALAPGPYGFIDDFRAHVRDWGFDPCDVKSPVVVEYGLQDVNVPPGHGVWIAENVPSLKVVVNEGGHRSTPDKVLERMVTAIELGEAHSG